MASFITNEHTTLHTLMLYASFSNTAYRIPATAADPRPAQNQ